MEENLKKIWDSPLFQNLQETDPEKLLVSLKAQKRLYQTGETILHPGELLDRLGIVLTGLVQVSKEDFQGNRALLAQNGPGQMFGEAFACTRAPLTVLVEASQETAVLWSPYDSLSPREGDFQQARVQIVQNLMGILAGKNIFLTGRIEHLSKRTLREKVLSYLSEQAASSGRAAFTIPLNRQEMADYLAADRSALSAVLGKLRREGIIQFHKNQFTLFSKY